MILCEIVELNVADRWPSGVSSVKFTSLKVRLTNKLIKYGATFRQM